MKFNIKIFLMLCLIMVLVIPNTSAFFTRSHEYWTAQGFEEVGNTGVVKECSDRLDIVLDGNHFTDTSVIHYFDDEFMSYVGSHTRSISVNECFNRAGGDTDLRCFCHGMALHNTQDSFSHLTDGLVPIHLQKFASPNLFGHMQAESDFEKKHMKLIDQKTGGVTTADLDYFDSILLDNFFEQTGGDIKYVEMANAISGLDVRNDINIFANGYKGKGFFDTVYDKKLKLPWWFYGISLGMIFGGIILL